MSPIDVCGLFILAYATVCCVWTLCEAAARPVPEPPDERPSALPDWREVPR